jgi:DNA/RNA endonuclease YhcR with UshA esterase domain
LLRRINELVRAMLVMVMKYRFQFSLALLCLPAFLLIAPQSALAAVKVRTTLTTEEALQHADETNTVCGVVASTKYLESSKAKPTFLNLDKPYPDQPFTAVISEAARAQFKGLPPEEFFNGKPICVTGLITISRGKPQIAIDDVSQIEIQEEVKVVKKPLATAEALQHAQETNTVCGVVASTKYLDSSKTKLTFLNLDKPYPDQTFTAVIPEAIRAKFKEPPEEFFKGKTICVTGLITINREKPQITIDDPSQIRIQQPAGSSVSPPPDNPGK